jgi:hypothetical protein
VLAGSWRGAGSLNEALDRLLDEDFDPTREAVLAGEVETRHGEPGTARVAGRDGARLEVEVEAPGGGYLVVQRSFLPLYRATVDGAAVRPVAANLHRLAIPVPAGGRRVVLDVDPGPARWAAALAVLGLLALLGGARLLRSPASDEPGGVPEGPRRQPG